MAQLFHNAGTLLLSDSTISGNEAIGESTKTTAGGGLYLSANATLSNCLIVGNYTRGTLLGPGGAGIAVSGTPTVTMTNCTIAANTDETGGPGGLAILGGTVTLDNTIVATNAATVPGASA